MTVVVALKTNNDIIIGSDTMVSDGNLKHSMDKPKFFLVEIPHGHLPNSEKTKILIGEAGLVSMLEYMRIAFKPPIWNRKLENFNKYMINSFFPSFKKLLEDKLYVGKNKDESLNNFSNLLVIHDEDFYIMEEDFGFCKQTGDYIAIGSGRQVALGSLYSTFFSSLSPEDRVSMAVKAAGELTIYVNTDVKIGSYKKLIEDKNESN